MKFHLPKTKKRKYAYVRRMRFVYYIAVSSLCAALAILLIFVYNYVYDTTSLINDTIVMQPNTQISTIHFDTLSQVKEAVHEKSTQKIIPLARDPFEDIPEPIEEEDLSDT